MHTTMNRVTFAFLAIATTSLPATATEYELSVFSPSTVYSTDVSTLRSNLGLDLIPNLSIEDFEDETFVSGFSAAPLGPVNIVTSFPAARWDGTAGLGNFWPNYVDFNLQFPVGTRTVGFGLSQTDNRSLPVNIWINGALVFANVEDHPNFEVSGNDYRNAYLLLTASDPGASITNVQVDILDAVDQASIDYVVFSPIPSAASASVLMLASGCFIRRRQR